MEQITLMSCQNQLSRRLLVGTELLKGKFTQQRQPELKAFFIRNLNKT